MILQGTTIEDIVDTLTRDLHGVLKDDFRVEGYYDSKEKAIYITFQAHSQRMIGYSEYFLKDPFVIFYIDLKDGRSHACYKFQNENLNESLHSFFEDYEGYSYSYVIRKGATDEPTHSLEDFEKDLEISY